MQITLNQAEIEKAIIAFVGEQGISITGKNVAVTLTAGRAPNGMSASIDISNDEIPKRAVIEVIDAAVKEATGLTFNQAVAKEEPPPFVVDQSTDDTASESKPLFGKN